MTIFTFDAIEASQSHLVGGKGANLGRMAKAGFPVPPGFCVSVDAYSNFMAYRGLQEELAKIVALIDFTDADCIERESRRIRGNIEEQSISAHLAEDIRAAYNHLGGDKLVAVRSSGTAEDLADASFAGLHDTYLDIRGADDVLHAIRRCWASMWSARAIAYRHTKGFDQCGQRLAVVVMSMVQSEVSGVLFTANPLTTATNEHLVNASWGLGEAIVSGIVTPDQYVLDARTLEIKERTIGSKQLRIVHDTARGSGTLTEQVPDSLRQVLTLNDRQLAELCGLARKVEAYYEGLPQDIEWALVEGVFYLLQSRPITGVELSWDEGVDDWQDHPELSGDVWTRLVADEVWTGATTPLMYSHRAYEWQKAHEHAMRLWGQPELATKRIWKYWKGCAYYNCPVERDIIAKTAPPGLRPLLLGRLPPSWAKETVSASFSYATYLSTIFRIETQLPKEGTYGCFSFIDHHINNLCDVADGFADDQLRALNDAALKAYIDGQIQLEVSFFVGLWSSFFFNFRDMMTILVQMVLHWYDGDNGQALNDLLTGSPQRTMTIKENLLLWNLSREIRGSAKLSDLFRRHEGTAFFEVCKTDSEGRMFLEHYQELVRISGHRGHSDRDIYFPRRLEDPSIDYRAIKAMLSGEVTTDPEEKEKESNRRREAVTEDVLKNISRKPLGFLKAEAFKIVHGYVLKFLIYRDNQRHWIDRATFSVKRGFQEISRRLLERGILSGERDFYFLSHAELYAVFDGQPVNALAKAKIAGRMRDFDLYDSKTRSLPMFLQNNRKLDMGTKSASRDGVLRGIGTSRGSITGTARVIKTLKDIGLVQPGDILVVNSTDPGWTPVFVIIHGIVLETGGSLAHGSLLAREYGLPAAQIADAIQLIPDGATITVDGDMGTVTIVGDGGDPGSTAPSASTGKKDAASANAHEHRAAA